MNQARLLNRESNAFPALPLYHLLTKYLNLANPIGMAAVAQANTLRMAIELMNAEKRPQLIADSFLFPPCSISRQMHPCEKRNSRDYQAWLSVASAICRAKSFVDIMQQAF